MFTTSWKALGTALVTGGLLMLGSAPAPAQITDAAPAGVTAQAKFRNLTDDQVRELRKAIPRSVEYVESAIEDLEDDPESNDYEQWFGRWTENRYDRVLSVFERIGDDAAYATYDGDCDKNLQAEVDAYRTNYIWLCRGFWDLSPTGDVSMASVIVHEESHFIANGGTEDYKYGADKCERLAEEHPDRAVRNADSYMFFADDVR